MRDRRAAAIVMTILLLVSWTAVGQNTIAITGGRVLTISHGDIENATVLVENGKIAAVGHNVKVPNGAQVIDARGKVVMPGLFDAEFAGLVARNAEGRVITGGGSAGIPFTADTIDRLTGGTPPFQAAGAALLRLAWEHRKYLLG